MKDIHGSLIFALCLLAFTAIVFFLKYGQERAQSQILEEETKTAQTRAMAVERKTRLAQEAAADNIRKAREAREMLERAKRTSSLTQKEIVSKLNAQLEREADARLSAEKAYAELLKQRDILDKTVAQTKSDLERLRAQKSTRSESLDRLENMRKLLKSRESEIEALKLRQAELERLNAAALEAQAATEREIERRGGIVLLPHHKRILSPNVRR